MPSYRTAETTWRSPVSPAAAFGLSATDRTCIRHLIGHKLAMVERELILQTLRYHEGNRTRAAGLLGISIRSMRDKIRNYRDHGESVPAPGSFVQTSN
jgi:DNA-binding NtrC family response regulator